MITKLLFKFSLLSFLSFTIFRLTTPVLSHLNKVNFSNPALISPEESPYRQNLVFASLPESKYQSQVSVRTSDARPEIVRQYLAKYQSDLEPYAKLIVELADQYNFDYRWLVAIAQQESNLCKKIPENSYNCWGWGIYGDKVTRFDSYDDALRTIAPQFQDIFLKGRHLEDPYKIMQTYTPPSNGSWAAAVIQFFKELE